MVDADNIAKLRDVELGQALGQEWVVESGLKQGEKLVVDGVQKVQPDAKVAPEPWAPTPQKASEQAAGNGAAATTGQ